MEMNELVLETLLTVAFADCLQIIGDYEGNECSYCHESSDDVCHPVTHLETCLHIRMKAYAEASGHTYEKFEEKYIPRYQRDWNYSSQNDSKANE